MIITHDFTKFDPAGTGELEFVTRQNDPDAKVHIRVNFSEEEVAKDGGITATLCWRTLCGKKLGGSNHDRTGIFDDSRICVNCHKAMGENAVRIFEREQFTYSR